MGKYSELLKKGKGILHLVPPGCPGRLMSPAEDCGCIRMITMLTAWSGAGSVNDGSVR